MHPIIMSAAMIGALLIIWMYLLVMDPFDWPADSNYISKLR